MTSQQPAYKGKVLQPAKVFALDDNERRKLFVASFATKGFFTFIPLDTI